MIDIYIINLKERIDRLNLLKQKFEVYKNINLIIVEAIKHQNGAIGCFLSHKKCLQIAKDKLLDNIIVIEDDCLPMIEFEQRLNIILEYLDTIKDDWDIFIGGVNKTEHKDIVKKEIYINISFYQINLGSCAHFMIYNKSSYDFFLNYDETIMSIDKCWYQKLQTYTIAPFLAKQMPNFSDICQKHCDYLRKFQVVENRLLRYQ